MTLDHPGRQEQPGEHPQTSLREYALLVPRLVKLLGRLLRDPRVPARSQAIFVMTAGYLVSPVDFIPDFVPGLGRVDDLVLVAFALDQILNRIPEEIVRQHWEGDEDVLEVIRNVLDIGSSLLPRWARRFLPNQ